MPSPLDARVDALFEDLPQDPHERLEAVAQLYAAIRERAALSLEPAVRQILKGSARSSYEKKVQVSREISYVLRDARLAIVDPSTEQPSGVIANRPRPDSHISRFYLHDNSSGPDGKRHAFHLKEEDASTIRLVSIAQDDRAHSHGRKR